MAEPKCPIDERPFPCGAHNVADIWGHEVESLRAALREAETQRDRERQARVDLADSIKILIERNKTEREAAERKVDEYRQALNVEHKIAMSPSIGNQHTEANRIEGCETCDLLVRDALRVEQPRQDELREWARKLMIARHRWHVKDGRWYPLDDDEWGELARLSGVLGMSDAELDAAAGVAEPERETPQSKHDEHFAAGFDAEGCELCMDAAECCQPEGKAAPFTLIHAEDCCRSG